MKSGFSEIFGRWPLPAILLLLWTSPALAGPPYETDDPEPTDVGHYEIYAFATLDGPGRDGSGAAGLDLNYGAVDGVQLTATLPVNYARNSDEHRWIVGAGDVELGVKYRFLHHDKAGFSAAIFPRVILPTARTALGTGRAQLLLPLWIQQDVGPWSLFGGGGFQLNPGAGNRDYWSGGFAVTRDLGHGVSLGGEVTHQGPDTSDVRPTTGLGIGSIVKLGGPYALLLSGGPTFAHGQNGFHAYAALGSSF